jgi:hypothetical protein
VAEALGKSSLLDSMIFLKPDDFMELDEKSSVVGSPVRPKRTKRKEDADSTPVKTRHATQLVLNEGLFTSPTKEKKIRISEGADALTKMSPHRGSEKASKIMDRIHRSLSKKDPKTAAFHKEAGDKVEQENGFSRTGTDFICTVAKKMHKSPTKVLPLKHMETLDETGGFHLVTPGSPHRIDVIAINPRTNVTFALIDGVKTSTLFPDTVDEEVLADLVDASKVIAKDANKSLRMTYTGLVIECYKKNPIMYSSVFPVFTFEQYAPRSEFELVSGVQISADAALAAAQKELLNGAYYQIHNEKREIASVVVDIAPSFESITRVSRGMWFKFDRATAPELFDWEPKVR